MLQFTIHLSEDDFQNLSRQGRVHFHDWFHLKKQIKLWQENLKRESYLIIISVVVACWRNYCIFLLSYFAIFDQLKMLVRFKTVAVSLLFVIVSCLWFSLWSCHSKHRDVYEQEQNWRHWSCQHCQWFLLLSLVVGLDFVFCLWFSFWFCLWLYWLFCLSFSFRFCLWLLS